MPTYRLNTTQDTLFAELIITLRKGFGMPLASYNESTGILTIPDDEDDKKHANLVEAAVKESMTPAEKSKKGRPKKDN